MLAYRSKFGSNGLIVRNNDIQLSDGFTDLRLKLFFSTKTDVSTPPPFGARKIQMSLNAIPNHMHIFRPRQKHLHSLKKI